MPRIIPHIFYTRSTVKSTGPLMTVDLPSMPDLQDYATQSVSVETTRIIPTEQVDPENTVTDPRIKQGPAKITATDSRKSNADNPKKYVESVTKVALKDKTTVKASVATKEKAANENTKNEQGSNNAKEPSQPAAVIKSEYALPWKKEETNIKEDQEVAFDVSQLYNTQINTNNGDSDSDIDYEPPTAAANNKNDTRTEEYNEVPDAMISMMGDKKQFPPSMKNQAKDTSIDQPNTSNGITKSKREIMKSTEKKSVEQSLHLLSSLTTCPNFKDFAVTYLNMFVSTTFSFFIIPEI